MMYTVVDLVTFAKRLEVVVRASLSEIVSALEQVTNLGTEDKRYILKSYDISPSKRKFVILQEAGHLRSSRSESYLSGWAEYDENKNLTIVQLKAYPSRVTLAFIIIAGVVTLLGPARVLPQIPLQILVFVFLGVWLWYCRELFNRRDELYLLVEKIFSTFPVS